MKYILFIKDDIAVAKSLRMSLDNINLDLYDKYEEVTEEIYDSIELPAVKDGNNWRKTDKYPYIDYPSAPEPIPESEPTAEDMLNALVGGMSYE